VTFSISPALARKEISPYIYGTNDLWYYRQANRVFDGYARATNYRLVAAINAAVERDLAALGNPSGLRAGHMKDIVVPPNPGKVAIYGWHGSDPGVVQGYNPISHNDNYMDYSHGTRLIDRQAVIDGVTRDLATALADPALRGVFTREPTSAWRYVW
jgi:hypothetical protein